MAKTGESSHKRWPLALALTVVGLVVLAVAGGAFAVWHFSDKAKPGVLLAGQSVAGETSAQLASSVTDLTSAFSVTFTDSSGKSVTATAADLGVTFDHATTIDNAVSADGADMMSMYNPFVAKTVPLSYTLDDAKAQQFLDQQFVSDGQAPQDASVVYDASSGKFTVTPGQVGSAVDLDQAKSAIAQAAGGQPAADNTVAMVKQPPAVSDAAAQKAADQANKALATTLTYTAGKKSYTVPASKIASWTTIAPGADGALGVGYDQQKMNSDLSASLDDKLANPPVDESVLTDPQGKTVAKVQWGINGTTVPASEVTNAVGKTVTALTGAKDLSLTVNVTKQAYKSVKTVVPHNYADPNGAKWIDVNLTTQTATEYLGSTKVLTYVIASGKAPNYTATGTFYVWLKVLTQTMTGPMMPNGQPEYVTPNVQWISYFYQGMAFHAAPWVHTFGTPHSHGCINMVPAQAKQLYGWAPLGTMVKVHY